MKQRRQPTERERATPCVCCNHPISHRHHLLSAAQYGETELTVQLCPNCHELVHWCYKEHTEHRWKWGWIWTQFITMTPSGDPRIKYILWLTRWMINLKAAVQQNDIDKITELAQKFYAELDQRQR